MKAVVHKMNVSRTQLAWMTIETWRDVCIPRCGDRPWVVGSKAWRYVTCARCRREKPKQGKRRG